MVWNYSKKNRVVVHVQKHWKRRFYLARFVLPQTGVHLPYQREVCGSSQNLHHSLSKLWISKCSIFKLFFCASDSILLFNINLCTSSID
jgi:hypothetical protein